MRASDADREDIVDQLKTGFAEGRLTKEEFDDRVRRVYASRLFAELDEVTADLPSRLVVNQPSRTAADQAVLEPKYPAGRTSALSISSLAVGRCSSSVVRICASSGPAIRRCCDSSRHCLIRTKP